MSILTRAFNLLDTAKGDCILPLFESTGGGPSNGTSGTLAGVAQKNALLLTDEPALYQNTNTKASPTWEPFTSGGGTPIFAGVELTGASSGTQTVAASAAAGTNTSTLPAVTGTLASTSGANLLVEDVYRTTGAITANANVVPANITGLSGAVVVGTYDFEATLYCTVASGTAGIAINQVLTTAVLGVCNFTAKAFLAAGIATQATATATSGTVLFTAADQPIEINIKGTFTVTTAGTFGLQMCQNTSNASNSVVNIGSTMKLTRIA